MISGYYGTGLLAALAVVVFVVGVLATIKWWMKEFPMNFLFLLAMTLGSLMIFLFESGLTHAYIDKHNALVLAPYSRLMILFILLVTFGVLFEALRRKNNGK